MITATGPRFDESLASVARELHVADVTLVAVAVALALFTWLERRSRSRWNVVPVATRVALGGPYRSSDIVSAHLLRAPLLVRVAAFCSFAFGRLFAPLVVLALVKYPFDGISIPLVPGMALALLNWSCAAMLLRRSRFAVAATRSGAVGSLMVNVGLLGIAGVHMFIVKLDRHDGIEHACSSSVTFVVLVFAVCSIALALLMWAALRAHEGALAWTPSRVGDLSVRGAGVDARPRERAPQDEACEGEASCSSRFPSVSRGGASRRDGADERTSTLDAHDSPRTSTMTTV